MLAGEYAILEGGEALACTINKYMTIYIHQEQNSFLRINSNLWNSEIKTPATEELSKEHRNEPLIEAIWFGCKMCNLKGVRVVLESELDITFGIGSSSALRLGVITAISALSQALANKPIIKDKDWSLAKVAFDLQKKGQGKASGYDIATQYEGGLILISPPTNGEWPGNIKAFKKEIPLINSFIHPFVGGKGAPTKDLVTKTNVWLDENNHKTYLQELSKKLIMEFQNSLSSPTNLKPLFKAIGEHRKLFESSPYFPERVASILNAIEGLDETWSYKTTGAGGEDAILLIGQQKNIETPSKLLNSAGWNSLGSSFTEDGVSIKKQEVQSDKK